MLDDVGRALALMLIFEGILPFISPNRWREVVKMLASVDESSMRAVGLVSMLGGLLLLWILR
jgi:hypothetical protein